MNITMNLTKMTEVEIKALVFDESEKIVQAQQNIQICREELIRRVEDNSRPKESEPTK